MENQGNKYDLPYSKASKWYELHDKTNKVSVRPAKTQISLGICPVWSESSLSAWRKLGSLATHGAYSEDSDQTGRMLGLRRVHIHFVGHVAAHVEGMANSIDTDKPGPSGWVRSSVPIFRNII